MNIRKELGLKNTELKIKKPTHGSCCTCQTCGHDYDDCQCQQNGFFRVAEYVDKLQAENDRLKELVRKLDGHYQALKELRQ